MKEFKLWRLFIVFAVCIMAIAGCGKQADTVQDSKPLQVVTTTTMITDLVQKIGGDHVTVQGLMGAGVDPHLYQASAGDVSTLQKGDIIFLNGIHLEGKMGQVFQELKKSNKTVVEVSKDMDPSTLLAFEEEGPDAKHEKDYVANYEAYMKELDAADQYIKDRTKEIPEQSRVLVTAHDAFHYFARAYGFEVKGLQGVSTATEAGTKDMNDLVQFIVDHKIKAIFVESSVPHKTIEAVQEACKAKGWDVAIGGELYSDSLGSPNTEGGTYIGMVKANIDTIVGALK